MNLSTNCVDESTNELGDDQVGQQLLLWLTLMNFTTLWQQQVKENFDFDSTTSKWLWMKDITDYLAQWLMRLWNGLGKPCCVLTFKVNLTNTLSLLVQRVLQWLKGACSGLKPDMWQVKLSTTCWRPSWARFLWTGGYIGTTPNVQRRRLVRCRLMVRFSVPSPTTWGSGWVWGCTEHDKCGDCNVNWLVHCELVRSMAQRLCLGIHGSRGPF